MQAWSLSYFDTTRLVDGLSLQFGVATESSLLVSGATTSS